MARRPLKRICKNCRLYDPGLGECAVFIIHEGKKHKLPVLATDLCFFEEPFFDPVSEEVADFAGDIQQVKMWVEDAEGNKAKTGTVKIEYPDGFFGKRGDLMKGIDKELARDEDYQEYLREFPDRA